jgi:acetyl-CoA synthetase
MLVLKSPWPSMLRTIWGDDDRYKKQYWSDVPGCYFTGDGARRDEDGYFWLMGRLDDVINVSGHRLGTAEIESALVLHKDVAEAAVVGAVDDVTGWSIYAFVILNHGVQPSDALQKELVALVRKEIGPIATPKYIQFCPGLPKTRSGKIMRRILRKIVEKQADQIGDVSTLADPSVVQNIVANALLK